MFDTASAPSQPSSASSSAHTRDPETRSEASSAQSERLMLGFSSSEELDVLSIEEGDLGDSPAQSPQYEELLEVVTRAMARLNIEWPAERQEALRKSLMSISRNQLHNLHVRACRSSRISTLRCQDPGESHIQ